jgi:hypothetical protein
MENIHSSHLMKTDGKGSEPDHVFVCRRISDRTAHHSGVGCRNIIGRSHGHERVVQQDRLPLLREMVLPLHGMVNHPSSFSPSSPLRDSIVFFVFSACRYDRPSGRIPDPANVSQDPPGNREGHCTGMPGFPDRPCLDRCFKRCFRGMSLNIPVGQGIMEMKAHGNTEPKDRSLYMDGKGR